MLLLIIFAILSSLTSSSSFKANMITMTIKDGLSTSSQRSSYSSTSIDMIIDLPPRMAPERHRDCLREGKKSTGKGTPFIQKNNKIIAVFKNHNFHALDGTSLHFSRPSLSKLSSFGTHFLRSMCPQRR